MTYAQLDDNNVCIGISQLSGEIQAENMLQIESYDVTLLGKKYENGKWIELPKPPVEPTEEEIIQAETLTNQAQIIVDNETIKRQLQGIDETNANILIELIAGGK